MHYLVKIWKFFQGHALKSEKQGFVDNFIHPNEMKDDYNLVQKIWKESDYISDIKIQDIEVAWEGFLKKSKI